LLAPKLDDMLDGGLRLTAAQGSLPNGNMLWSIEDLTIEEGAWTLVKGSEGSGKTTLLRLLAGAWPAQEGTELRLGKATLKKEPKDLQKLGDSANSANR